MDEKHKNCETTCLFYEDIILTKRDVADMKEDIREIKEALEAFINCADEKYVQKIEFLPIKKFVYGTVGATMLAVAAAMFTVIFK